LQAQGPSHTAWISLRCAGYWNNEQKTINLK
jgi:hypothetical protein